MMCGRQITSLKEVRPDARVYEIRGLGIMGKAGVGVGRLITVLYLSN